MYLHEVNYIRVALRKCVLSCNSNGIMELLHLSEMTDLNKCLGNLLLAI